MPFNALMSTVQILRAPGAWGLSETERRTGKEAAAEFGRGGVASLEAANEEILCWTSDLRD